MLQRSEWQRYFDTVSHHLDSHPSTMIVLDTELGAQPALEHVPLLGLGYDPSDDTIDVAAPGLEHRIVHPTQIWVQEDDDGALLSVEFVEAGGRTQILALDHPVA
jgi:hypothetical protein